jgi:hypothetical protein
MGAADIAALWRGDLPLQIAFWRYLVVYGLVLNLGASLAMLLSYAAGLPVAIGVALHFLPVPYNAVAAVGTWRSADREKNQTLADAAKLAAPMFFLLWLVI